MRENGDEDYGESSITGGNGERQGLNLGEQAKLIGTLLYSGAAVTYKNPSDGSVWLQTAWKEGDDYQALLLIPPSLIGKINDRIEWLERRNSPVSSKYI